MWIAQQSAAGTTTCPSGTGDGEIPVIEPTITDPCKTTKEDLAKVFPNTSDERLKEIADAINKYAEDFGLDSKEKLQHFLVQAGHESKNVINGKEFEGLVENLGYRWKNLGTAGSWEPYFNPVSDPKADPNKADPNDYKKSDISDFVNQEKFANYVYADANRGEGYKMGNTAEGDGYKYRGRGIFQLTGKENYQKFTTYYKKKYDSTKNFEVNPELLATDREIAVISALWYYKQRVTDVLDSINNKTDVDKVSTLINGGAKGKEERKELFDKLVENIDCDK